MHFLQEKSFCAPYSLIHSGRKTVLHHENAPFSSSSVGGDTLNVFSLKTLFMRAMTRQILLMFEHLASVGENICCGQSVGHLSIVEKADESGR